MFLSFFIDFIDVFCNFLGFQVFVKILIFFFRAAAEPKSLPPRPRRPPPRRFYALVLHGGVGRQLIGTPEGDLGEKNVKL